MARVLQEAFSGVLAGGADAFVADCCGLADIGSRRRARLISVPVPRIAAGAFLCWTKWEPSDRAVICVPMTEDSACSKREPSNCADCAARAARTACVMPGQDRLRDRNTLSRMG